MKALDHMTLIRGYTSTHTFGHLSAGDLTLVTLELPWKGNLTYISCIPEGWYKWTKHTSPTHGPCISIKNVPDRTHVLIHVGNTTKNTEGCILVGSFYNGKSVLKSRNALTHLLDITETTGTIEIK